MMLRKLFMAAALLGVLTSSFIKNAAADEYIVGAHMPLTGSLARAGQAFTEGMKVAQYLHNLNSPYKVKLEIIDDESTPTKAITAVEKFANNDAVAIIGGYGSNIIAPASEAANRYGITYMTAGGVSEELTKRGFKTFFRINNNGGYAKALNTLLDEIKPEKVAILINTRSDAAGLLANTVSAHLKQKNIAFSDHPFDAATSNFQPLVNRIRLRDKPDVLLMIAYENDYIGILRAAKLIKPNVKAIIGTWGIATLQMEKDFPDLVERVIGSAQISFPVSFNDPEGIAFQQAYKKINGKDIDYMAIYGYTEAKVVFDAIDRLANKGDFNKANLAHEIREQAVDSLIGKIKFDNMGENINFSLRMAQHQGKELPIVSPMSLATKPMQLPARPWQ